MEQFKTPSPISLTYNPAENWCSWEQSIQRYIAASEEKDKQEKIEILLHTIGKDSLEVSNVEQLLHENLHMKEEPEMLSEGEEEKLKLKVKCEDEEKKPYASQLHWRQLTEISIKKEPEILSEGQEKNQLCFQQEINSAVCPVKNEDEEEKPQVSQLHWRQLTEINIKEEPSTCTIHKLMKKNPLGIKSKGPEAPQNPDPSSLVLQGPDGTETDSSQTEDSNKDDDEDCWQKSQSKAETEFDSTRKKRKMSDSSKKAKMGCKDSKTQMSSCQQFCSKKVHVKIEPKCVDGTKASVNAVSELKINSGHKPFKCDVCSKCFSQSSHLNVHFRIHSGEKPFKCDVCSKCFSQSSHFNVHFRIHSGEKPFKCDVCSKCFKRKSHLELHMSLHSGEKPFKCDVCSKCFTRKSSRKVHMRLHSGEKPFKCDVCSKCFTRKSSHTVHMRIHSGEKPFKCDVCSKGYIQKFLLDKHMRIHSGEKPFKCDVCRECFIEKSDLDKHMSSHT